MSQQILDLINARIAGQLGHSGGYPSALRYIVKETGGTYELCVEDAGTDDKVWKLADPWGFAVFDEVCEELALYPNQLNLQFIMRNPSNQRREEAKYEALKRRLSYLADKNKLSISLTKGNQPDALYTMSQLANRPAGEIIQTDFSSRGDDDTPGRLEKDFQTYLFGKGLYPLGSVPVVRTNERLAILGKDFHKISKSDLGVEREWPTGVFGGSIEEATRILPTEYIDLVTINKSNEIAIIELKFDDPPLEVIAQLLNYVLFAYSYRDKLEPVLDEHLGHNSKSCRGIKGYVVSNVFHPRFPDVWKYYAGGVLPMQQVVMGYYI